MAARKKASGFVTEEQRHTKRVVLRLDPGVAAELRWMAGERDMTVSDLVAAAIDALKREEDDKMMTAISKMVSADAQSEDGGDRG